MIDKASSKENIAKYEQLYKEAGEDGRIRKKFNNFHMNFHPYSRQMLKELGCWDKSREEWGKKNGTPYSPKIHSERFLQQTGEQFFADLDNSIKEDLSLEEQQDLELIIMDPKSRFMGGNNLTERFNGYMEKVWNRMLKLGYIKRDLIG